MGVAKIKCLDDKDILGLRVYSWPPTLPRLGFERG